MALTPKRAAFCLEYLVDLNGTQAAIRAGFSARTANVKAAQLLADPDVQAEIQRLMAERAERTKVTSDQVLEKLWAIASADPNELVEFRRRCCRRCWGKGHRWQETAAERERRRAAWKAELAKARADDPGAQIEAFDQLGGLGWDPRRDPALDCPECFGEGVGQVVIKDTGRAALEARELYAGVKVTRDGVEVVTHSKLDALDKVARHLGMFIDRKRLEGANGGPIEHQVTRVERVIVDPKDPDR